MNKTIRNIIIFAVFAVGGGWLGVFLNNITGQPHSMESLGALIFLVTPALTGILLRAFGGDGWKDAGFGLQLRSSWKWYLVAVLIYPLIATIAFVIASTSGAISTEGFAAQGVAAFISAAAIGTVGSAIKNIFEEFAWRGYLTPRLEAAKIPALLNHIIVGVVWWAWHLPYYFYLLDRAQFNQYLTTNLTTFLVISFIAMIPTAILFGELRLLSKSVWPVFLLHNVINGISLTFLLNGFIEVNGLKGIIFSPLNDGVFVFILFGVVGMLLYRKRMAQSQAQFAVER